MLLALPLALLQSSPVPDLVVVTTGPAVLLDNYYENWPSNCDGQPLGSGCHATLAAIYYPTGDGPTSLGYANPPRPVWINLRGGNGNPAFPEMYGWFLKNVLPKGFVGVDPNYPVVQPGEDYHAAAAGVAKLVQYLRHYSGWLNVDPNRIFLFGRSFGGFMSLTVGLKEDYQDPASADPIEHQSSRPDYLIPFSPPTDLTCFSGTMAFDWLLQAYFPVSTAPGATTEQKLADSPTHWLMHPELYGRTYTPPMCLGYLLQTVLPCGVLTDPHDGTFGLIMRDKIDEFVDATNDAALGIASALLDTNDSWGYWAQMDEATDWALEQLSPPPAVTMYHPSPKTPIGPAGSFQQLKILGAVPGAPVYFFVGFAKGPVVVPGCPLIQEGIPTFFPIGGAVADAQGRASLTVFVPSVAIGWPLVFHVADFANCRVSNVLEHTWKQ
jgi:hypothetical protein